MTTTITRTIARLARSTGLTRRMLLATGLMLPLLAATPATQAQDGTPTAAVKTVVENILAVLRKPDYNFENDRAAISAEIRRAFDDVAMAQSVLSTNWKNITPAQQDEFKGLLLQTIESTYIGRIKVYTNEVVEFRKEEVNENRASVDSAIISSSGDIPVDYKLRKRADGWFIYDVEVENVSMVSSYRDTYRSIFTKDGIDGLIAQMKAKIAEMEG
jgi:phospholipid transport system substrate-binding protein